MNFKYAKGDRVVFVRRQTHEKDYNLIRETMILNERPAYILDCGYILYELEIERRA